MMKAIIFSRVSTMTQDLEQQEQALFQAAKSDGYTDENIIVISEHESAVKNDISERLGITKAKQAIENQNVEVIYAFELSRIARRLDVFYDFRKFLIEHKVQLKIINPKVNLLDDEGNIDENFSLVFGIFASLAEQEARLMQARFKRGKQKLRDNNLFTGGTLPFGYTVNQNKEYVILEEEGELIRKIFRMYQTMTITDIAKELVFTGEYPGNLNTVQSMVRNILNREYYTGTETDYNGYKHTKYKQKFPAIIDKEIYNAAQRKMKERKTYCKTKSKHSYLCRGIIHNINGELLRPLACHNSYALYKMNKMNWETMSIKMDILDEVALYYAVENKKRKPGKDVAKYKVELREEIKSLDKKLVTIEKKISACNDKILKIEMRYIDGKISESMVDLLSQKVQEEIKKFEAAKHDLEADREDFVIRMNNLLKSGKNPLLCNNIKDIPIKERIKIVHDEIENIIIIKGKKCFDYTLGIQFFGGDYVMVDLNSYTKRLYDESGVEVAYKNPS